MGWYAHVLSAGLFVFSRNFADIIVPFAESPELLPSRASTDEMLHKPSIRSQLGLAAALFLTISLTIGCRGKAYRDVYQQKMAGEIRNLEDQLYEADYQNQVLHDQLMRAEMKAAQVVVPENRPRRTLFGKTLSESGEVIDVPGDLNRLSPPLSPPFQKNSPKAPTQTQTPNTPKLPASPLVDPKPNELLVPPSEPVPPGAADLLVPDVQLGEPIPPPEEAAMPTAPADSPSESPAEMPSESPAETSSETPSNSIPDLLPELLPEAAPGQIKIPDSAKVLGVGPPAEPVSIRVNLGLSGGHKSDNSKETEGVSLFVEAIDEKGEVVSLDQFDIDANMSVVLLDPSQPGSTARIGKWDFGPSEIREMLRPGVKIGRGGVGLNVVIPWGKQRPESPTVIAHVRLSAGDVAMQTQAEIPTALPTMAQWTPRATRIR